MFVEQQGCRVERALVFREKRLSKPLPMIPQASAISRGGYVLDAVRISSTSGASCEIFMQAKGNWARFASTFLGPALGQICETAPPEPNEADPRA